MNVMRQIKENKLTLNIGVGEPGDKLEKAYSLLERITKKKPVRTKTKKRIPKFNVRPGLIVGVKVTIRKDYEELLKRLLGAVGFTLKKSSFDNNGNISFGIDEYVHIQGLKYDPKIPMFGLNVSLTLERAGFRIKRRRINKVSVPKQHKIKQEEAISYFKEKYGVEVI